MKNKKTEGYWSVRDGGFKKEETPSSDGPRLLSQQGGWMATKEQIIRMNNKLCKENILPFFSTMENAGSLYHDDLGPHSSDFWSGSNQFYTGGERHCNMQRIISMNPDHFSKHLLYHTANDKQKQMPKSRMVRANDLFGQLNHVKKIAEHEIELM